MASIPSSTVECFGLVPITPEFRYSRALEGNAQDNRFTGLAGFTFGKRK